jgi:hypothetical protein
VPLLTAAAPDPHDLEPADLGQPHLSEADVRAALGFAADYLRRQEIIFGEPATAA